MSKAKAEKKSRPGQLRIVAGNWRSRLLQIADVPGLRPTAARIRETLFNWLAPRIAGARCLDLFAGTGALGLEALSRGAASCVFVEKSARAAEALRRNAASLGAANADIREMDARRFLRQAAADRYDIVFLDPPFAAGMQAELCRLLSEGTLLAEQALVYIEEDRAAPPVDLPPRWQVLKTGRAGNVRYSLVSSGSRA